MATKNNTTVTTSYSPERMSAMTATKREVICQYNDMAREAYHYGRKKLHDSEFSVSDFAAVTGLSTSAADYRLRAALDTVSREKKVSKTYIALDENGNPDFSDTYHRNYTVTMWRFV